MEATKENFYEYITSNSDGVNKYTTIIANELYQTCISEKTKETLGIKELYIDDTIAECRVSQNATSVDTEIAYNEILNLINKIRLFRDLIVSDDTEINSKPIYKFEDVINGIKNQKNKDFEINYQSIIKVSEKILNLQKDILIDNVHAFLISLMIEILKSEI